MKASEERSCALHNGINKCFVGVFPLGDKSATRLEFKNFTRRKTNLQVIPLNKPRIMRHCQFHIMQ
jgi:hypothetical protein